MSLPTVRSTTRDLSLSELIERLARHEAVDGVLVMGSARDENLKPESDYDLLVVLSEMPVPLHLIFTQVDQRLTEIYVTTTSTLNQIRTADKPPRDYTYDATVVGWLQTGTIRFDRGGRLTQAQEYVRLHPAIKPQGDRGVYSAWFNVNYNLQQTRRMFASDDPVYLMSVDLRLLYTIHHVWVDYFLIRRLPGMSEKEQVRYVAEHDPEYLALFQRFMHESDRGRKMSIYEQLARLTVAPVGDLLDDDATMIQLDDDNDHESYVIERGLAFWQRLIDS